ncbi:MAG: hypothetical protein C4303_00200 [candidate division GAL15 bacterium]
MKTVATMLAVALAAAFAAAQPARTVAVAPFWDLSTDGALVDADRLNVELSSLLAATGRFRVVSAHLVAHAMRSLGSFPAQLFHPARAREVREAVGADWLVVGRWTHLASTADGEFDAGLPRRGGGGAVAVLDVWVWERANPRPRYEATFDAFRPAVLGTLSLKDAAEEVLRKAAAALGRL